MTNRTNRKQFLKTLRRVLADLAYGIDAGNAIRHGLPVPPRRAARGSGSCPTTTWAGSRPGTSGTT